MPVTHLSTTWRLHMGCGERLQAQPMVAQRLTLQLAQRSRSKAEQAADARGTR